MSELLTGKPVLVPWDFSELSKKALKKALTLVGNPKLIHVVHVGQIPMAAEPGVVWGAVTEETIAENAEQHFQKLAQEHPEFTGLQFKTLFGDPGMALTDYAEELNAELIVVSSHGRTGLSRFLLGSVAERVVRHAHCPVLVLRELPKK